MSGPGSSEAAGGAAARPQPAQSSRILIVGDVIDDLVVRPTGPVHPGTDTPATIEPSPGGSGANQAVWTAAAGGAVRFVGRVGAADVARHRSVLEGAGVEARLAGDLDLPTGRIVILVDPDDGERSMYTDRGANLGLRRGDLPDEVLDGVAVLHVSGYSLFDPRVAEPVLDLVARARRHGVAISVDPASRSFLEELGPARFLRSLGTVDLAFPNLDEGRVLTGRTDPREVATTLLDHAVVVVLTLGAQGVLVVDRTGSVIELPASAVEVVDTTGAGDAFCGAFLAGWVAGERGRSLVEQALATAGRAVTVPGGRPR